MIKLGDSVASIGFIVLVCILWVQSFNHWIWLVGIGVAWYILNRRHRKVLSKQQMERIKKEVERKRQSQNEKDAIK